MSALPRRAWMGDDGTLCRAPAQGMCLAYAPVVVNGVSSWLTGGRGLHSTCGLEGRRAIARNAYPARPGRTGEDAPGQRAMCTSTGAPDAAAARAKVPVAAGDGRNTECIRERSTGTSTVRDLDVVITHSTADFDSLAAAVGLAKLRGPNTVVVVPGGEAPSLQRFLLLHRQLYRIADPKSIDTARLRWVGVVDTVRKDRLGVASTWPELADHVEVFDHHIGRECDITNPKRIDIVVDAVGAVATLICERLHATGTPMTPAEATLLALAIHSDTGSLTYEHSTPRDAAMLSWLMAQGAVQRSIAEFSASLLTNEQQLLLSQGLVELKRTEHRGVKIGSVVLVRNRFLKGMSDVATDLLDLSNVDVLVLTYVNCRGRRAGRKKRKPAIDKDADAGTPCGPEELKQVSIICRARARTEGVDFRPLLASYNGGGHERAASAALKMTEAEAEELTATLVENITEQIPVPVPVSDFMTTDIVLIESTASLQHARELMTKHRHMGLPVVNESGVLVGLINLDHVASALAQGDGLLKRPVSGWMRHDPPSLSPDTPLHVAEQVITEHSVGRVPIVDKNGRPVGVVGRTDVLVQRRMWYPHLAETGLPASFADGEEEL